MLAHRWTQAPMQTQRYGEFTLVKRKRRDKNLSWKINAFMR